MEYANNKCLGGVMVSFREIRAGKGGSHCFRSGLPRRMMVRVPPLQRSLVLLADQISLKLPCLIGRKRQ